MTKLDLQKEILEKIKPGTKPSDLKKSKQKPAKKPISPPPISIDEGYSSEEEKVNKNPTKENNHPPLLRNDKEETSQIKALQKQLQIYKDFWAGDLKAKEKLKEENNILKKTIQDLKTSRKNPENIQSPEIKPETFTCSSCTHTFNIELIRLVKKSGKKICRNCTLLMLKRANQFHGQHIVLKVKKTPEKTQPAFTCQTCQQPSQGEPHPVHITNYQESGINPRQLTSVCSTCLNEKVTLANFYCPRTSEGRDTYDPQEPQFDCDCPISERSQP